MKELFCKIGIHAWTQVEHQIIGMLIWKCARCRRGRLYDSSAFYEWQIDAAQMQRFEECNSLLSAVDVAPGEKRE